MESEPLLTPREKSPLQETQRGIEPTTLHHAGQQTQHTTDWAIPAPYTNNWTVSVLSLFHLIQSSKDQTASEQPLD